MATTKVSALTAKTVPSGAEELLINDGGVSKKITIANLPDTDTNTTYTGGTGVTLTGTSFSLTDEAYTTGEKNKLAGVATSANNYSHPTGAGNEHLPSSVSQTEAGYLDGVTSAIQTQIDTKQSATADYDVGDNVKIKMGASDDLQIYHDGSNSYIDDAGTGNLILRGSASIELRKAGGIEKMLYAEPDAQVDLYYDNAKKLSTNSSGIAVTGTVAATSYTGDGSALTGIDALPSQTSQSGKYLTTNGTTPSWNTLDTDANSTTKGLYEMSNTISTYVIGANNNAISGSPVTVTGSVTIPSTSTWTIV